ncbi:hypothetical protein [Salipiger sp.]|uniref:hypothetical protein n=1 Tax=Salipiger sp. TaxID=2078585 RepID=UPI003A9774CD
MQHTDDTPRDVGKEAGDDLKRSAERLHQDAREAAESVGSRAREEASHQADRAKSGVASELSSIAHALSTAASELRGGSAQEQAFGKAATSFSSMSDAIRDRDLADLASDVSAFARRNPFGFLAGAALTGFAATRFARASSHGRPDDTLHDDALSAPAPAQPRTPTAAPATAPGTRTDDVMASPAIPANHLTPGDN